jgi:sugar lactone lactonase YvrE
LDENFKVSLSDLRFVGQGLNRPECVLATASGDLYASHREGGVQHIFPDGKQEVIGSLPGLVPNGIALMKDRSFLVSNLHGDGGVWKIGKSGDVTPFLMEVDGVPLSSVNFVRLDANDRLWICVNPVLGSDGRYRTEAKEGFIAVVDRAGARIATDSIGWANECVVSQSGSTLFVNETFSRKLTAFDISAGGSLSNRRVVTAFGDGTFPDGLSLDSEGGLWVISVVSNRIIRVDRDGKQSLVLHDEIPEQLQAIEEDFGRNQLTRGSLASSAGSVLKNISSLAFGGADRRTAYLGSIGGTQIATFQVPVAGVPPIHWLW